ncbi:hypothetical protein DUNSADRAFT_8942 [Dunaliella salina]|uniref:Encoded protein n=1 Tax=Dunaliella salina TaxID=3046 RepID=A0ABQ7GIH2_DUNSA|nr:hypothetical protein DUNSADRAFT_8942 [Dunaliella salina]|eukprot:KAF5834412.1 hypothetical protein DUNSADRAFT_8942 [Dunaliella salina]
MANMQFQFPLAHPQTGRLALTRAAPAVRCDNKLPFVLTFSAAYISQSLQRGPHLKHSKGAHRKQRAKMIKAGQQGNQSRASPQAQQGSTQKAARQDDQSRATRQSKQSLTSGTAREHAESIATRTPQAARSP